MATFGDAGTGVVASALAGPEGIGKTDDVKEDVDLSLAGDAFEDLVVDEIEVVAASPWRFELFDLPRMGASSVFGRG